MSFFLPAGCRHCQQATKFKGHRDLRISFLAAQKIGFGLESDAAINGVEESEQDPQADIIPSPWCPGSTRFSVSRAGRAHEPKLAQVRESLVKSPWSQERVQHFAGAVGLALCS